MERNEQNPAPDEPQDAEPTVPDKQIDRWKDDGGPPLPPEPKPEPTQDQD